jgi:RimJ/RimL family protein N-acetyltransferase
LVKYEIREGLREDINGLKLRDFDILELTACSSKPPEQQLKEAWEKSDMRWTVLKNGEVACVLGCCGLKGKFGVPWLLGTDLSKKVKQAFVTDLKLCLAEMLREYRCLINYVHPQNKQSIRWLQWLGFKIKKPVPFGEFGILFHPFTMSKDV